MSFPFYIIICSIIFIIFGLLFFWLTGITDPGLLNRNEDCNNLYKLPIKVVHKGIFKITKACQTCNIIRPFRSSHCRDCDNCIQRFDHHCPWLGGCIGKRNYIFFYLSLLFINLNFFFILFMAIIQIISKFKDIKRKYSEKNLIFKDTSVILPSLFIIIYLIIILVFTAKLQFYHSKFILNDITTKEEIKKLVHSKIGNPYNRGIFNNCFEFCCRKKKAPALSILKQLQKKIIVEKKTVLLKPKMKVKLNVEEKTKKEKKTLDNIYDKISFQSKNRARTIFNGGREFEENVKINNVTRNKRSYTSYNKINNKIKNKIVKEDENYKKEILSNSYNEL